MKKGIFYWHVHHDTLVEQITEPIENRIEYIKSNKPKHEIETRLRLMKPATGINAAYAEYKKIQQPALAEYEKIADAAYAEYKKIAEKLHKEQCGCKEWNGNEIDFNIKGET